MACVCLRGLEMYSSLQMRSGLKVGNTESIRLAGCVKLASRMAMEIDREFLRRRRESRKTMEATRLWIKFRAAKLDRLKNNDKAQHRESLELWGRYQQIMRDIESWEDEEGLEIA